MQVQSTLTMFDCYKKLIDSLCDRSSTTSGSEAKYLDECDSSQYVTADVYTKTFYESHIDQTTWHTVVPYSTSFCYALPLIGSSSSAHDTFVNMAYDRLGSYMKQYMLNLEANKKAK